MKLLRNILLPLIIITLLFNGCKNRTIDEDKIDNIFNHLEDGERPGSAVAIVKDGSVIYKKGFGMANLEYDIPITTDSIFHTASVSKQFTAFAVLLLEKDGKITLDDDIKDYIPEIPDYGKTITIRHLLSHTSGLRGQWDLLYMAGWRKDDVITMDQILKMVSKQKKLNFEPGEKFLYCNTGYALLAEIVSRASGMSFSLFTKFYIFDPLKMNNTQFYDDHEKIVKNRVYSYRKEGSGYKKNVLSFSNVGATSLFSTVEDLALWTINFETHEVGGAELINKMNTLAPLDNGETAFIAYGQFIGKYKGLNNIRHSGEDAGYRSYITRFPEQNMSVIALSNDGSIYPWNFAHKVVDIVLADDITSHADKTADNLDDTDEKFTVDSDKLAKYTGVYEFKPGYEVTFSINEDGLLTGKKDSSNFILYPKSEGTFTSKDRWFNAEFYKVDGEIESVHMGFGGKKLIYGIRKRDFNPAEINLTQYTGVYYSEELTAEYTFTIRDNRLTAINMRLDDEKLTLFAQDRFDINMWFFGTLDFVRDESGNITGFEASTFSGRVQKLWFEKRDM